MTKNIPTLPRATFTHAPRPSANEIVQRVAEKASVSAITVTVFARFSDPEKKHLFTAVAAQKAFAHVKVNSRLWAAGQSRLVTGFFVPKAASHEVEYLTLVVSTRQERSLNLKTDEWIG